jgi:hypothetical protein
MLGSFLRLPVLGLSFWACAHFKATLTPFACTANRYVLLYAQQHACKLEAFHCQHVEACNPAHSHHAILEGSDALLQSLVLGVNQSAAATF